jgi:hypothetical protein
VFPFEDRVRHVATFGSAGFRVLREALEEECLCEDHPHDLVGIDALVAGMDAYARDVLGDPGDERALQCLMTDLLSGVRLHRRPIG